MNIVKLELLVELLKEMNLLQSVREKKRGDGSAAPSEEIIVLHTNEDIAHT